MLTTAEASFFSGRTPGSETRMWEKLFGALVDDCMGAGNLERAGMHVLPLLGLVFSDQAIIPNDIARKPFRFAPFERLLRGNPAVDQTDLPLDFVVGDFV